VAASAPRALVWTDDDISDAVRAGLSTAWPHPQLLRAPDPRAGLTTRDLDLVEAFVRRHH
jgi:hypothetical protein